MRRARRRASLADSDIYREFPSLSRSSFRGRWGLGRGNGGGDFIPRGKASLFCGWMAQILLFVSHVIDGTDSLIHSLT